MKNYYLRERDYGSSYPTIIDEETMEAARFGENRHNPDEFVELCKVESMDEALDYYYTDVEECSGESVRPCMVDSRRDFEEARAW